MMTVEFFEKLNSRVNAVTGAIRDLTPEGVLICLGMTFDTYCAEQGLDPVELSARLAELVEGVNRSEGPYNVG